MNKEMKFKIISEGLNNSISITCKKYNISRTLYYRWLNRYKANGIDGLSEIKKNFIPANKIDLNTEAALLNLIKQYPHYGPKYLKYLFDELGYNISESAIYNILKRNNLTTKSSRLKFSKKQNIKPPSTFPHLNKMNSGEFWIFWITDYGSFSEVGHVYEYTLFDFKSKISCSRLYKNISFDNFEDILTSTAIPVSKGLNLEMNYLCFLATDNISSHFKKSFISSINKIIAENSFEFQPYILSQSDAKFSLFIEEKNAYTKDSFEFLMPLFNNGLSFERIKLKFQEHIRNYNIHYKINFNNEKYSPLEYHNKITNNKVILPIWAYINRDY